MGVKNDIKGPKITRIQHMKILGKKEAVFALVPIFL